MTIIMIIVIIVIVLMAIKLLESMGQAAPYVMLFGGVYALHYVIWDFLCWIIGILLLIGLLKNMWDNIHKKNFN